MLISLHFLVYGQLLLLSLNYYYYHKLLEVARYDKNVQLLPCNEKLLQGCI